MMYLPKEIINQILLFSGHLVVLGGKLYPIRKITKERKDIIENTLISNPVETGFDVFDNFVIYIILDITIYEDNPKFIVISKYFNNRLYESNDIYLTMITNTPYIYENSL